MSVSPYLDIYSVTIAKISRNSIFVPINIGSSKQIVKTLINCSAGGLFIDQNFAKKFKVKHLKELIKAFNVDGTKNKKETIKSYVDLEFQIELPIFILSAHSSSNASPTESNIEKALTKSFLKFAYCWSLLFGFAGSDSFSFSSIN